MDLKNPILEIRRNGGVYFDELVKEPVALPADAELAGGALTISKNGLQIIWCGKSSKNRRGKHGARTDGAEERSRFLIALSSAVLSFIKKANGNIYRDEFRGISDIEDFCPPRED